MLYVYADRCTTCSSMTRSDILNVVRYGYKHNIDVRKVNTRYSRESRQQAIDNSKTLKNPITNATNSYTPYIYSDTTGKAILLSDFNDDTISSII